MKPQPSDAIGGDPGFAIPLVLSTNNKAQPVRQPDVYVDSKEAGGLGLGCFGYKFTTTDPTQPAGPNFHDGDMGDVTISGHTGGADALDDAGAPVPKPITCKRNEIVPSSGIFNYACNTPGPVTGFMEKTNEIVAAAAGGVDLNAWSLKIKPSPHDDFVPQLDLWKLTTAHLDGTADLNVTYSCSGGPCSNPLATYVITVIETTDGSDPVPVTDPFDFPPPKNEFGLIQCFDYVGKNLTGFSVAKEALAALPQTWTDARVTVGTYAATQGQVQLQPTLIAVGFASFGVSHRRPL